ncbi:outer membrane beta-barrel protein [uncultured Dokdonia sp.]|uniref:outer membrane beta-barrel protein n=1 Tax=uncultured Dokdonia sp. TaxID=575653 RepID=UPI0026274A13|nr:outer membrane beta-barrel protein [uncultured Dokdonia sp.]
MKKNILLLVFSLIFISTTSIAQNYTKGSIATTSNETIKGRVLIDYETQKISLKKDLKESSYTFSQVKSVTLGTTTLVKGDIDGTAYYTSNVVSGKGSLYKINDSQYLITGNNGKNVVINTDEKSSKTPGKLAVLFDDCNSIRALLNNEDNFNAPALRKIVEIYNTCDYGIYTPTKKEVKNATLHNTDQASFFAGIGAGLNNVRFFDNNNSESLASVQVQAGVIASPSFFGRIQGNLFITLEGSANFSGEKDFDTNTSETTSFRINSYRAFLGLEYLFNKTGKIKPFAGFSIGVTSDSFEGNVDGFNFDITGGNPILAPKIGVRLQLPNQKHIGITFTYVSEYENNLSFPVNNTVIPLIVNNENVTLSLNYYF